MRIRILGSFEVAVAGRPVELGGRKQRAVLAALVLEPGRTVGIGRLVDIVWGGEPPARAEASLQAYVSNLRRALEPDRAPRAEPKLLVSRPGGYALDVPADAVDVTRFEQLVQQARTLRDEGALDEAAAVCDEALALWSPPLPEFADEPFVVSTALRLEALAAAVTEERADLLLAAGRHRELLPEMEAGVRAEPLREHRWYQLAVALYRSGQQAEALRAVSRAREVLAEETGLSVGPDLERLESDLLSHAPTLASPARPTTTAPVSSGRRERPARRSAAVGRQFVGREHELELLNEALDAVVSGTGRIVVISGEPGIGKTRLAEELTAMAEQRGVVTAWARCPESAATETLRPMEQLGDVLAGAGLAASFARADLVKPAAAIDGEELDPFVGAVRELTRAPAPFLCVIDDLQWADPTSLRVIERVATEIAAMPGLVVATVRPLDASAPLPLVECLGELARQPFALRISLTGLEAGEVGAWIAGRQEATPDERLVEFVHDRTAGNPFFVQELVSLLAAEDRLDASVHDDVGRPGRLHVPDAVADVIRRRVGRLPASTQQLLPAVAVVGRSFDADVAALVTDRTLDELLDDLDAAMDAGLVNEDPDTLGRFGFSHALVAEALAAELSAARRARVHAATARAIEALRVGLLDEHLAELGHHALAGALAGSADLAIRYAALAADRATAVGAHEDAVRHRKIVVRALELGRPGDRQARYDALLELGRAHRRADDAEGAIAAFADAVTVAEQSDDVDAVTAAAVLLNESSLWQSGDYGADNAAEVAVVERVLALLPEGDSAVRAELLGALASFLYYVGDPDRCERLSVEALEMARRVGEPATIAKTLNNRSQAGWRPGNARLRRELADELLGLCEDHDLDPELRFLGEFSRMVVGMELGEPPRARLDRARKLAAECRSANPLHQMGWFEATLLSVEGKAADAERVAGETLERYRRTRRWGADVIHLGAVLMARIDSGRGEETLVAAAGYDLGDYAAPYLGFSAWTMCEIGQPELARAVLGPPGTVPELRRDWLWVGGNTFIAQAVGRLNDAEAAGLLHDLLVPHAGHMALAGTSPAVSSVDHALGRLATVLGDLPAARDHLTRGIELETAVGSVSWAARGLLARAELGMGDGAPPGIDVAADLAGARMLAERHGMIPVLARLGDLG